MDMISEKIKINNQKAYDVIGEVVGNLKKAQSNLQYGRTFAYSTYMDNYRAFISSTSGSYAHASDLAQQAALAAITPYTNMMYEEFEKSVQYIHTMCQALLYNGGIGEECIKKIYEYIVEINESIIDISTAAFDDSKGDSDNHAFPLDDRMQYMPSENAKDVEEFWKTQYFVTELYTIDKQKQDKEMAIDKKRLEEIQAQYDAFKKQYEEEKAKLKSQSERKKIDDKEFELQNNVNSKIKEFKSEINTKKDELQASIQDIEKTISELPFFDFLKKSQKRKEIQTLKLEIEQLSNPSLVNSTYNKLQSEAHKKLDKYKNTIEKEISAKLETFEKENKLISDDFREKIDTINYKPRFFKQMLTAIQKEQIRYRESIIRYLKRTDYATIEEITANIRGTRIRPSLIKHWLKCLTDTVESITDNGVTYYHLKKDI